MASDDAMNAYRAFVNANFKLAVDLYDRAISRNPQNAKLHADRAQAKINLDDSIGAVADAEKANHLDPSLSEAYLRKGIAFIKLRQYDRAKAALREGVSLTPQDSTFANLIEECEKHIAAENDDSNPLKTLISCLKEIPLPQLKSFTLLQNPSDYYQIKDTPTSELLQKISELVNAASVEGYVFKIPVRTQANAVFDRKLQRYILRRVTKCRPKSGNSEIAYVRTLAVLKSLQKILQKKTIKYVTKRGLYYANKEDFTKQTQLDGILDDITSLLECKREALKIVADEKGVVVGDLRFTECGDNIDCSKVGAIGKPIFPDMAKISDLESNALLVLLVESRATFTMLAAENFHKQLPVIIITGGGIPDLGTRLFLRRLRHELGLPVFAVMDCDPYGIFIMSAYRYGVYSSAFQDLTTPDIKWLGLRPTELDRLDIPNALEGLSHADTNKLHELRNMTCFENAWREELDTMSRDKKKAEFEVLHTLEGYSVPEYLYAKLLSGDWI